MAEARRNAAAAWVTKGLTQEDEARLTARFGSSMTAADHDRRMERLLLDRATTPAARQLANTSPAKRQLYTARLALVRQDGDVQAQIDAAGDAVNHDPGFMIERARYLRDKGDSMAARIWLAQTTCSALPRRPAPTVSSIWRWPSQSMPSRPFRPARESATALLPSATIIPA
jgi:soluble lytic murein transglycosylase